METLENLLAGAMGSPVLTSWILGQAGEILGNPLPTASKVGILGILGMGLSSQHQLNSQCSSQSFRGFSWFLAVLP